MYERTVERNGPRAARVSVISKRSTADQEAIGKRSTNDQNGSLKTIERTP
jgi:hypothetical protein